MPELRRPTRSRGEGGTNAADGTDSRSPATTGFEVAGSSVSVSGDPTEAEAAALAAVLAEYLRAGPDDGADEEPRFAVDPWCLAGRLGTRSPCRVPDACPAGREWKTAGRASTR